MKVKKIYSEIKRYERKSKKTISTGERKTYTTTQFLITLKKEDMEKEEFMDINEVAVIKKTDWPGIEEALTLAGKVPDLELHVEELRSRHDILQNDYAHLKAVNDKLSRTLSDVQNENTRLQNRGVLDLVYEKLRGNKKKSLPEGED